MPMSGHRKGDGVKAAVLASSEFLGHGLALAASVAFFGWVGWEIGERVGSPSLSMLIGILVGGAAGFYHLYDRLMTRLGQERDCEESEAE